MGRENSVTLLGVRGSMAVSGAAFSRFGGATTCVSVTLGGRTVLLDAGSGLLRLPEETLREPELPLLLTHLHLDHLMGLPMCPYLFRRDARMDIYAVPRGGVTAEETLERLLSPPLWPVGLAELGAQVRLHPLEGALELGGVRVEALEGEHSGGVSLFRLTRGEKRVVFATDCTFSEALFPIAAEFARDCDLLLADGQYSEEEWPRVSGFGHSTWLTAARLGEVSGAKQVRVIHHAPLRTDGELERAEREARRVCPRCSFGREGEVVYLGTVQ